MQPRTGSQSADYPDGLNIGTSEDDGVETDALVFHHNTADWPSKQCG